MDYYAKLGVSKNASPEEIKKAYRKLAMEHHPDRGGDVKKFQDISQAYDTLSDPQKKAAYDNPQQDWQQWTPPEWAAHDPFAPGSAFSEAFGDIFGRRQQVRKNPDGVADITISVQNAYTGTDYRIDLGYTSELLQIPAGVRDGTKFRLAGRGPSRFKDLPPGDLLIRVNIDYPGNLGRDGDDLFIRVGINAIHAITGHEIDYEHISGKQLRIKVPPGTQPGNKLRLQGWGMPNPQTRKNGDMYVLVSVTIPKVTDPQHINWLNIISEEVDKNNG